MDKFEEKLKLAKVILTELKKGPVSRVNLLKRVIESCGSPAKFDSTFNWLKKTGRICKVGSPVSGSAAPSCLFFQVTVTPSWLRICGKYPTLDPPHIRLP